MELYIRKHSTTALGLFMGAMVGLGGCSPTSAPAVILAQPEFRLTATIQDLMAAQIDPSADALWDSVAYIATEAGTEDRKPHTDAEWKAVRTSAITLIEATNLLCMQGRLVSASDSSAGPGELTPAQIQQRIETSHAVFVQFAHLLQQASMKALDAIDAKNPQALMDAGSAIDEACEACHVTYWYPNQIRPRN